MSNLNNKIASMTKYLCLFFAWLKSRNAQALPADLHVRWSAFWADHGLPKGWSEDGTETATRNFFLRPGRIPELKKIYESGNFIGFKAAAAKAVCEELGEDYDAYLIAQASHETTEEESAEDEDSADEHEGGPGIPAAGAEHIRRRFEDVQ